MTTALERLIEVRTSSWEPPDSQLATTADRSRRLAEIDRAFRSESWSESESLIEEFEQEFPDDPALNAMKEQLDAGRKKSNLDKIAQLEAARQVNDPGRVIELYLGIAQSLEDDQRGSLERDLAKWFLGLIHRRLRSGKIQLDVVHLAAQVSETFAATVEGASMRRVTDASPERRAVSALRPALHGSRRGVSYVSVGKHRGVRPASDGPAAEPVMIREGNRFDLVPGPRESV